MARRDRRSVSLHASLARAIDEAAAASGASFKIRPGEKAAWRRRLGEARRGLVVGDAQLGLRGARTVERALAAELLGRPSPRGSTLPSAAAGESRSAPTFR